MEISGLTTAEDQGFEIETSKDIFPIPDYNYWYGIIDINYTMDRD